GVCCRRGVETEGACCCRGAAGSGFIRELSCCVREGGSRKYPRAKTRLKNNRRIMIVRMVLTTEKVALPTRRQGTCRTRFEEHVESEKLLKTLEKCRQNLSTDHFSPESGI